LPISSFIGLDRVTSPIYAKWVVAYGRRRWLGRGGADLEPQRQWQLGNRRQLDPTTVPIAIDARRPWQHHHGATHRRWIGTIGTAI
jgi:hypothetical protein